MWRVLVVVLIGLDLHMYSCIFCRPWTTILLATRCDKIRQKPVNISLGYHSRIDSYNSTIHAQFLSSISQNPNIPCFPYQKEGVVINIKRKRGKATHPISAGHRTVKMQSVEIVGCCGAHGSPFVGSVVVFQIGLDVLLELFH